MLEISHLTRTYGSRVALEDVSLTLEAGKTCALLGPNGSGKTTLMKIIEGLARPTSGTVLFKGMAIGPETKKHIAYMPTENYFFNYMSIRDAGRYYDNFFEDFSMETYLAALSRMDLEPADKIRSLSSGMAAKVRLALTLSRDADLMMFDEPLNGVDILTRTQVVREIIRNREAGRTMIISTHLIDDLETFLDSAIFLRKGRIALAGTRDELRARGTLTELYLNIYGGEAFEDA